MATTERPSHLRGDGPCQDCGGLNIVWYTLNVLWNAVCRDERTGAESPSIVCVPCFVKRVEDAGYRPTGWLLVPDWPWARGRGEGGGDG